MRAEVPKVKEILFNRKARANHSPLRRHLRSRGKLLADELFNPVDDFHEAHPSRIDGQRISRSLHRGGLASGVLRITTLLFVDRLFQITPFLERPTSRPVFRSGSEENLHLGRWKNNRTTITPFRDQAGDSDRALALRFQQRCPHTRKRTDPGSQSSNVFATDLVSDIFVLVEDARPPRFHLDGPLA